MEKIRKLKNRKGFTLVELIVVLVILAILAALLIPALTGYIDKANKEKVISETRMVAMAVQTECSEAYGQLKSGGELKNWEADDGDKGQDHIKSIIALAEVLDGENTKFKATAYKDGSIATVMYTDGTYTCTYDADKKTYDTKKASEVKDTIDNSVTFKDKTSS